MSRFDYHKKGFTITEFLAVMVIMGLIISGAIAIYIRSTTIWQEGGVQIILQRNASMVMEKMVRGVYGTNGIREANSVALYSSNTEIRYTSGIDNQERSFYLSGSEIIHDPNTSVSDDEFSIAENARPITTPANQGGPGLEFSVNNNIVTIEVGLIGKVIDKDIKIDLSTEVKLRN